MMNNDIMLNRAYDYEAVDCVLRCASWSNMQMFERLIDTQWHLPTPVFTLNMSRFQFGAPRAYMLQYEHYVRSHLESYLIQDAKCIEFHQLQFDEERSAQVLTSKGVEINCKLENFFSVSDKTSAVLIKFSSLFGVGQLTHRLFAYTTKIFVVNPRVTGTTKPVKVGTICVHVRVASLHEDFTIDHFKQRMASFFYPITVNCDSVLSTISKLAEVTGYSNAWDNHPTVECAECGTCRPVNGSQIMIDSPVGIRYHAITGLKQDGVLGLWDLTKQQQKEELEHKHQQRMEQLNKRKQIKKRRKTNMPTLSQQPVILDPATGALIVNNNTS